MHLSTAASCAQPMPCTNTNMCFVPPQCGVRTHISPLVKCSSDCCLWHAFGGGFEGSIAPHVFAREAASVSVLPHPRCFSLQNFPTRPRSSNPTQPTPRIPLLAASTAEAALAAATVLNVALAAHATEGYRAGSVQRASQSMMWRYWRKLCVWGSIRGDKRPLEAIRPAVDRWCVR